MSDSDIEARVMSGKSWEDFCDALKEAGKQILRPEAPSSVLDRAEGWRYLSRLLRLGLESKLEFSDTDFPGVYALSHETAKIGADNPDNIYHNITIDGSKEYRIFGKRGTVPYFSWGTKVNRYTTDGTMASIRELDSNSLIVEADGTYEIILSQTRKGKNWLPIAPDSTMVLGRQTFLDRKTEISATAKVERIGGPKHPEPLSAERLERGLQETAAFVLGTARAFADLSADFKRKPNDWITTEQEHWYKIGGDPKILYLHLYWELKPDEALVIESKVPECAFWNLQVDNWWWELLDYRYLPVHVHKGNAKLNKDGSVTIVIAAKDMGVGNYLDTAGHHGGTVLMRWVDAKSHPIPTCRVVKLSETVESLEAKAMADTAVPHDLAEFGLNKIVQIGFVVRDIDEAIARYNPLFGPFKKTPKEFAIQGASYKGAPRSPYELAIAFGYSGDLEIELIQWVSGDTPHRDFIEAGREGMHHVQFRVDDCDAWAARLNGAGYQTVWYDRLRPDIAYAYMERPGDPLIVEFLEYPASGDATEPLPD